MILKIYKNRVGVHQKWDERCDEADKARAAP